MDELLNSNYAAVIASLSQKPAKAARWYAATLSHTLECERLWLLLTQGEFREAASILSSKISTLVSLCLGVCVCMHVLELCLIAWLLLLLLLLLCMCVCVRAHAIHLLVCARFYWTVGR